MTFWQTVAAVAAGNALTILLLAAAFVGWILYERRMIPIRYRRYNEKHGLDPSKGAIQ